MRKLFAIAILFAAFVVSAQTNLWVSPDRIPLLCVATNGDILAFDTHGILSFGETESGYTTLDIRRSSDGGSTWTADARIMDDGVTPVVGVLTSNNFGAGSVVIDQTSGKIFATSTWYRHSDSETTIDAGTAGDSCHCFVISSTNNGQTWTAPLDITTSVRKQDWGWFVPGPAVGVQLPSGRLVMPFYYGYTNRNPGLYYPAIMYSDDHGATWQSSYGATNNAIGYDECAIAATTNGGLLMIARNDSNYVLANFGVSHSADGVSWTAMTNNAALTNHSIEGSMIRYSSNPSRLLFMSLNTTGFTVRTNASVWLSYDEGNTWTLKKSYYPGLSGYSALSATGIGKFQMFVENGTSTYSDQITFSSDTISNLTAGADIGDIVSTNDAISGLFPWEKKP